jgi:hypothetical protein
MQICEFRLACDRGIFTIPRTRVECADGTTTERRSRSLCVYQGRTLAADALIAWQLSRGHQHARRVRRALTSLFGGAVGKDIVSRNCSLKSDPQVAAQASCVADSPEEARNSLSAFRSITAESTEKRAGHQRYRKKSLSGASRRRLCFPLRKPLPCCSGHCFASGQITMRWLQHTGQQAQQSGI